MGSNGIDKSFTVLSLGFKIFFFCDKQIYLNEKKPQDITVSIEQHDGWAVGCVNNKRCRF